MAEFKDWEKTGKDDCEDEEKAWLRVEPLIAELEYESLLHSFFLSQLKAGNDRANWLIILISSGLSFSSMLNFDLFGKSDALDFARTIVLSSLSITCLLYTSDAADE